MSLTFLRILLPTYLVTFLALAFVWRMVAVAKMIGKNPFAFTNDKSVHSVVGGYLTLDFVFMLIYVFAFALAPQWYRYQFPFRGLEHVGLQYAGLGLFAISITLTVIAQAQMRSSWRIGIDAATKTDLVTHGLFRYSRNPIYLGILLGLIGLFLVTPNALTAFFALGGYVLLDIQIRLEEAHVTQLHGQAYLDYRKKVRRWV